MQVGEQDLPLPELLALGRERLLHLHYQLGAREDRIGPGRDLGAGSDIVAIGQARADARVGLDQDLVALGGELVHGRGDEPHSVLVILDLLGNADQHERASRQDVNSGFPSIRSRCRSRRAPHR